MLTFSANKLHHNFSYDQRPIRGLPLRCCLSLYNFPAEIIRSKEVRWQTTAYLLMIEGRYAPLRIRKDNYTSDIHTSSLSSQQLKREEH